MSKRKIWPMKLWIKLFQARRLARRLQRKLDVLQEGHASEVAAIKDRYEEHLAYERARTDRLQTEWASRFVQLFKQQPMLVADLDSDMTDPRYRHRPKPEDILGGDAFTKFEEEKERFWEEGVQMGLSPAAIQERWKEVAPQVIEEIG